MHVQPFRDAPVSCMLTTSAAALSGSFSPRITIHGHRAAGCRQGGTERPPARDAACYAGMPAALPRSAEDKGEATEACKNIGLCPLLSGVVLTHAQAKPTCRARWVSHCHPAQKSATASTPGSHTPMQKSWQPFVLAQVALIGSASRLTNGSSANSCCFNGLARNTRTKDWRRGLRSCCALALP